MSPGHRDLLACHAAGCGEYITVAPSVNGGGPGEIKDTGTRIVTLKKPTF